MLVANASSKLPAELLAMVMDHVDLMQLVQLSHISVRWRAVARSHPHYWRSIRLAAVSPTALEFFVARLDRSLGRIIAVDICLEDSKEFEPIRSIVLPTLERYLAKISRLGLFLHHGVAYDSLYMLSLPAPQLEALAVQFLHFTDDQPAVLLNADLLAGFSPKLTTVVLQGVSFPSSRIEAFNLVDYLRFNADSPQAFDIDLLHHFPALKSLSLIGVECTGVILGDRSSAILSNLSLNRLDFHFSYSDYDAIFSWIPRLEGVSTIICRRPSNNIAERLLGQLSGNLKLAFLCPHSDLVSVTMSALADARVRTFVQWESHILEDWPRDAILASSVLERITAFRLLARLAFIIPHLEAMPACKQLEIVLLDDPPFVPAEIVLSDPDVVRFPALESLVITLGAKNLFSRTVPAEALHAFLVQILGPRTKRATLRFERIHLSGDKRELARAFNGV